MTNFLSRWWWRRIWCALNDHGWLTRLYADGDDWRCKRCGAVVDIYD
jgi:hypothetical protein